MNRCKECGCICPDFSDVCDCCAFIEEEERIQAELDEEDKIQEEFNDELEEDFEYD